MPASDPLTDGVRRLLNEPFARVRSLQLPDGRRFWLKRVERLSARMRVQKGNPARAFAAEREGLRLLAEKGVPVPPVVAEGADPEGAEYLVLPDAGPTLVRLAKDTAQPEAERLAAFHAAGRALALLHRAGMVHGRPAVRDICWDGSTARFIDLERFSPARHGSLWQALDLVILAQSAFAAWPGEEGWLAAAWLGYVGSAPDGALRQLRRLVRGLAPLGLLARGLLWLRPASRELRAVPMVLAFLRR